MYGARPAISSSMPSPSAEAATAEPAQDGEVRILPCRLAGAAPGPSGARAGPGRPAPRRPRHSSRRAAAPGEGAGAQPDVQDQQRLGTQRRRLPAVRRPTPRAPGPRRSDDGHFPGAQQRRRRRQPFQTQVLTGTSAVTARADRLLRMHDPLAGQGPVQVARAIWPRCPGFASRPGCPRTASVTAEMPACGCGAKVGPVITKWSTSTSGDMPRGNRCGGTGGWNRPRRPAGPGWRPAG